MISAKDGARSEGKKRPGEKEGNRTGVDGWCWREIDAENMEGTSLADRARTVCGIVTSPVRHPEVQYNARSTPG